MLIYPLLLDAEQSAGDVLDLLADDAQNGRNDQVLIRERHGVRVRWFLFSRDIVVSRCDGRLRTATLSALCDLQFEQPVESCDATRMPSLHLRGAPLVVMSGDRVIGLRPAQIMSDAPAPAAAPADIPTRISNRPSIVAPASVDAGGGAVRTRGQRAKPPLSPPSVPPPSASRPPSVAPPTAPDEGVGRGVERGLEAPTAAGAAPDDTVDTLLAIARVDLPDAIAPAPDAHATLTIGLAAAPSPTAEGVMTFESSHAVKTIDIDIMVEAPDFTCDAGWKYTLTVDKSDPFAASVTLELKPVTPGDRTVRTSTVRVHYTYKGQPAGAAVRTICLGAATAADIASVVQPPSPALSIAPSSTPVDLTIRISRRDQSDSARDLIWTIAECAFPIALPDAPIVQKVGDRDTASSFATKVTNMVNTADGTVTVDNVLRSIGTLIRRAMPAEALKALSDVAAAVGGGRLARVLLLTDECFVPWELALLEPAPNPMRAPYLGAQFAVSRWLHGETDVPVPPPATLCVSNLAVVLGNYDASSLAALPHAKEESQGLSDEATQAPTLFPRVTSVDASPDALVDLLNGALPSPGGPLAPELVHFACHGEVLGTGIAKRSVLYMSDGTALSEILFVSSDLGRKTRSFLFMNACQVGVGGDELGQYAGFPGMAIGAGFSGFVGPLWSVNDQIAKGIALDFYRRTFGSDGKPAKPVAEVLADMRSQYASEADPKKRSATWLAYVHYGHPHFTFAHA
jgi:hypothetical protein